MQHIERETEQTANMPVQSHREMELLFARAKQIMWDLVRYKELQMIYSCAIKEVTTKFEILNTEFELEYKRNPIASIQSRLKRTESILDKLIRRNHQPTLENVEKHVLDMAGVRIICSYVDDIYRIADALLQQDDITLLDRKDYILNPKPNGYRSLHLIVTVPVFLSNQKRSVPVEVQIRTIAMDCWASLEHQLKYKQEFPGQTEVAEALKDCAELISQTDSRMLEIRRQVEAAQDVPDEEDELLEKLSRLDLPLT